MKRLIWKPNGKTRCIRHLAARISTSFEQTQKFVEANRDRYPLAKPSVDVSGHLDAIFEEYAYNTEWASQKQIHEVELLALQSAYSVEQIEVNKGKLSALQVWLEKQIKEMQS